MTRHRKRAIAITVATIAATAIPATGLASTVYVHDEGHLHETNVTGSTFQEEGTATGTLPGRLRVQFTYDGSLSVKANFTITGNDWSLTGEGKGTLSNPNSPSPSFRGPLKITSGRGHYAHAHASGELFGVFYRRKHYALTVQTLGALHY